jgi:hypothetical protein
MPKKLALLDKKFGRLTVVSKNPEGTKSRSTRWDCICDCGGKTTVRGDYLVKGDVSSCGCLQKERTKEANTTHGMSDVPEYKIWKIMIQRCNNPKYIQYHDYGGKGITVCERWLNSFQDFITDLGKRPGKGYRLKRTDTNKNYELNNCAWIIGTERTSNKTKTKVKEIGNNVMSEWTKYFGNTGAA